MTPPIPIGLVLTSFHAGGTERQFSALVERLDRGRYAVHVACFRREGHWRAQVEAAAASVTEFPLRGFRSPGSAVALARFIRWCRHHQLALVQAADFYANVFGLTGARLAGVPVRIGSRRDLRLPGRTSAQHQLQRQSYRFAHRIVANSRAAAGQLRAEGVPERDVTIIHNGLDVPPAATSPSTRSPRVVTMVANLRPGKGHECLLDAVQLLRARGHAIAVQLAGDGPLRQDLERAIVTRDLADCVHLLGHRPDVPALLAGSDIFVLPSWSEAFPNGLMEAMASGLPVIASGVGGVLELVVHEQNGLLVRPGDAAGLAAALERLLADPATARRLGLSARGSVATRYSFDVMTQAFDDLYAHELRQRGGLEVPPRPPSPASHSASASLGNPMPTPARR